MKKLHLKLHVTLLVTIIALFGLQGTCSFGQSLLGFSDLSTFEKLINGKSHFSIDTDGEVVVEGIPINIQYNPLIFNGAKHLHWTNDFTGKRYCIICFRH